MAAAISSPAKSGAWLPRLRILFSLQRFCHTVVDGGLENEIYADSLVLDKIEIHKWKKLDSRVLGINKSRIPAASWTVLKVLQSSGFEAYLIGGCVRDLLLHKIPKDFDVITTAALSQIRKKFHRSIIVGRRFPICIVQVKGSSVEVSSFETVAKESEGKDKFLTSQMPTGRDEKDVLRWRNSMHRDFTINSLFFDPFANKIYDYSNALMDLRSLKLRTLVPAHLSFSEDCARILRALRLAARLNLSFEKDTDIAIRKLSLSITNLAKARIMMELNYMLSYGAAGRSLNLLQRYNLLEILLPFHAAYLTEQSSKQTVGGPLMLMRLFSNMDQLLACDRPSDSTLWFAVLAFHLALVKDPQHVLVVLTFASLLYNSKWSEGVRFSREHAEAVWKYAPEILDSCYFLSADELAERVTGFAAQVKNSVDLFTDTNSHLESMVFLSQKMRGHVKQVFDHLTKEAVDITSLNKGRHSLEIDYRALGNGDIHETRFVLGKIIINTMLPKVILEGEHSKDVKANLSRIDSPQKVEVLEENCQSHLAMEKLSFMMKADKKQVMKRSIDALEKRASKRSKGLVNRQERDLPKDKEETESCQLPSDEIRSILECKSYLSEQCETIAQEAKEVHSKKLRHGAKKNLKILEKVNNEVVEKQGTSMKKLDLALDDSEQKQVLLESVEPNSEHLRVASESYKKRSNSEKVREGSPNRLSNLFR